MRYIATSKADAEAAADKAHQHKIATDPHYAKSVAEGRTLRWSFPLQETDKDGNPVGGYYIPVEEPVLDAFSIAEQTKLDASAKQILANRLVDKKEEI